MKKLYLLMVMICLALLSLTGCSGKKDKTVSERPPSAAFSEAQYDWDKGPQKTLEIWSQGPELQRSYMVKAFQRYRDLTGNDIKIVEIPQGQFEAKTAEAFATGTDTPDLILSYGGSNIDAYDPDRNFYDFIDAPWVDDLTDTSINQTIYHGRIIGLPHWEASVSGTLYNKEIFDTYNLEIPKTQEEFKKVCKTLQDNGVTPLYLPAKEITMLLYQFPLDILVADPDILNGLNDGTLQYADIPEMKQIVDWYRSMAQEGYFGADYQNNDWAGMDDAMNSGTYAMMLGWDTWLYTDFDGDPEKFGLMPAFMGVPEEGTFEGPNLGMLMVNKNSPNLDSALNFITFMADPYNYNPAFDGIFTAPVFKQQIASISTPQYIEAERLIERNFSDSIAWLRIKGFSQMDASCILDYMKGNADMTAEQCLKEMDALRNSRILQMSKSEAS